MIESKYEARRKVRDAKILDLYNTYRINGGAKREVTCERIAKEVKTSVTTAKRVTKSTEAAFKELTLDHA